MPGRRRIVIVGGGFGGLHLVRQLERRLRREEADVTVIDRHNYHLFTPLLYQVATGELPAHAVAYPLRDTTARAGFRFVNTQVEAIDVERRAVDTADGAFPYDHVVIAAGSVANDYGIAGVREHALQMKELADAEAVRRSILSSIERAAMERDAARRRHLLAFAVVGAGPTGVEVSSSLRDLMRHSLRPMYPQIDFDRDASIVLIDGSDRVLAGMDLRLSRLAMEQLLSQRIKVVLRTLVNEIRPGTVLTKDGGRFDAGTVVWSGGVKTNPLVAALALPQARDRRLVVDDCFRAAGRDDVFALGDAASFEQNGAPLPQLAQVAVLEAPAAARNLLRSLRGEPPLPYRHKPKGDLIALGRTSAGAKLGDVVFGGLPAWSVWRVNYLTQLLGVRNRATLLAEWTLSYFFSRMVALTP